MFKVWTHANTTPNANVKSFLTVMLKIPKNILVSSIIHVIRIFRDTYSPEKEVVLVLHFVMVGCTWVVCMQEPLTYSP